MPEPTFHRGSIKAGLFTAQLGSGLEIADDGLTLTAAIRSYRVSRERYRGTDRTSLFGLFKRGLRIRHDDPGLPSNLVFYPACGQEEMERRLAARGWEPG
ncbi:MAG: hypothetical protein AAF907_09470 [Planctomycetota bacterium]